MLAILGASGKVGRATIAQLRRRNLPVRAILRRDDQAADFQALGCETVLADINDGDSLRRAFAGAAAVQVICPVAGQAVDAAGTMRGQIDRVVEALQQAKPDHVLAISDYGAEQESGTGVTLVFRYLESALRDVAGALTLLRSSEHMQNWARFVGVAIRDGVLPSLHQPLNKAFPTVAAQDVGLIAADLLAEPPAAGERRIIHVEGPRRYTAEGIAAILATQLGRPIRAVALPPDEWSARLTTAGLSPSYAAMVVELFQAHNAGRIDAEPAAGPIRRGTTEMQTILAGLIAAPR
jgi:uncharacterized protein YbjT (DUF2867 family)